MDDAELRENLKRLAAWANSQGATIGLHAIEAVHRIDELTRIASRLEADEAEPKVRAAFCEGWQAGNSAAQSGHLRQNSGGLWVADWTISRSKASLANSSTDETPPRSPPIARKR